MDEKIIQCIKNAQGLLAKKTDSTSQAAYKELTLALKGFDKPVIDQFPNRKKDK